MKIHAFRLTKGMDLKKSIEQYVVDHKIKSGVILSAVGCLYQVCLRTADGVTVKQINEDHEIVSATGTLSMDGCHIHVSLSDVNLKTIGGHLKDNCLVNVTAEIVLGEFYEFEFTREFDESTGYKELVIKENTDARD
mgnify:FL=1